MRTAAVVAAFALSLSPAAVAKGGRAFDRHSAGVGDTILVSVGTLPVATSSPLSTHPVVSVYLMPLDVAPKWWPTYNGYGFAWGKPLHLPGVVPLGHINVSRAYVSRLQVVVPRVAPGQYVLGYWDSGARWTSALPALRVDPYGVLNVRQ
jgi:hypothetical protein